MHIGVPSLCRGGTPSVRFGRPLRIHGRFHIESHISTFFRLVENNLCKLPGKIGVGRQGGDEVAAEMDRLDSRHDISGSILVWPGAIFDKEHGGRPFEQCVERFGGCGVAELQRGQIQLESGVHMVCRRFFSRIHPFQQRPCKESLAIQLARPRLPRLIPGQQSGGMGHHASAKGGYLRIHFPSPIRSVIGRRIHPILGMPLCLRSAHDTAVVRIRGVGYLQVLPPPYCPQRFVEEIGQTIARFGNPCLSVGKILGKSFQIPHEQNGNDRMILAPVEVPGIVMPAGHRHHRHILRHGYRR